MLDGLLQAIENLTNFSFEESAKVITTYSYDELISLVKFQLESGIDGDGEPIHLTNLKTGEVSYNYAPFTIHSKLAFGEGIGAIVDHVTLYDTGEFYSSLYINIYDSGDFEILSKDPKYPLLVQKSGDKLLKLAPQSAEVVQERYVSYFQYHLNQALTNDY